MSNNRLPEKLAGQWIWSKNSNNKGETHIFFRRDFILDEIPPLAELWISAGSYFHLYINGRHCNAGIAPSPEGKVNAMYIDITYLLQPGTNQIAVCVFNTSDLLCNQKVQYGGLWLQINIDDHPYLWTDDKWRCMRADGYLQSAISQSFGMPNVELVDYRMLHHTWKTFAFTPYRSGQNATKNDNNIGIKSGKFTWLAPNQITELEDSKLEIIAGQNVDDTLEVVNYRSICSHGFFESSKKILWVNFRNAVKKYHNGVFIAQTSLYTEKDGTYEIECDCDRPYRLFLNNILISEQVPPPPPVRIDPSPRGDRKLGFMEYAPTNIKLKLFKGWNQLFFVEDADSSGHGITILFDCGIDEISCHTTNSLSSPAGWTVAGPLKTPFALILPQLYIQTLGLHDFILNTNPAWDASFVHKSLKFTTDASPISNEQTSILRDNEFMVFDFGHQLFGYPQIKLEGSSGDVIDIVCGEVLQDGHLVAFDHNHRLTSTLFLSGEEDVWLPSTPRGYRYVMIMGRNISKQVKINLVQSKKIVVQHADNGAFTSSDPIINKIWHTGELTLNNSMWGGFIDSPTREHTQYIADAMIQSWAAYHLFGDFSYVRQSIYSFAKSQFETGDLNAMAPSSLYQSIPDYSLLWVIWLHRHFLYTGDENFLHRVFPCLERLLTFFNNIAIMDNGPLSDMHEYHGCYAQIDQDPTINVRGISTSLNAIYSKALQCASDVAYSLDCQDLYNQWRNRAISVAEAIRKMNFRKESGDFADSYLHNMQSESSSWQSNVLAIYGGFTNDSESMSLWNKLFCDEEPYLKFDAGEFENPYFKYFILDVATDLGKHQWVFDYIKYYWGSMLKAGAHTWWEFFNPLMKEQIQGASHSHGYGVSPNGYLISNICGLTPACPGFTIAEFAPKILELDSASFVITTVCGIIIGKWETDINGHINISLSANFDLRIIVKIPDEQMKKATLILGELVTIME